MAVSDAVADALTTIAQPQLQSSMGEKDDLQGQNAASQTRKQSLGDGVSRESVAETPDDETPNLFRMKKMNTFVPHSPSALISEGVASSFRIPIVGYEVMEERARFTVYKLQVQHQTSGESWFVFRRYTDFVRLHSKLKNEFPNLRLSLPRKRWFGNNFDQNFLEDRIKGLQGFVDAILTYTELYNSKSVKDFFCLDEPPSYTDSIEESRAIFESLEETVYLLRHQLKRKESEAGRLKMELKYECRKTESLTSFIRSATKECASCSKAFASSQMSLPSSSTPKKEPGSPSSQMDSVHLSDDFHSPTNAEVVQTSKSSSPSSEDASKAEST